MGRTAHGIRLWPAPGVESHSQIKRAGLAADVGIQPFARPAGIARTPSAEHNRQVISADDSVVIGIKTSAVRRGGAHSPISLSIAVLWPTF